MIRLVDSGGDRFQSLQKTLSRYPPVALARILGTFLVLVGLTALQKQHIGTMVSELESSTGVLRN